LKLVPFKRFGTVSYSHFIVTMAVSLAVSEISSVKVIENNVVRRPYTTFYWSAIVSTSLSCTIWRW